MNLLQPQLGIINESSHSSGVSWVLDGECIGVIYFHFVHQTKLSADPGWTDMDPLWAAAYRMCYYSTTTQFLLSDWLFWDKLQTHGTYAGVIYSNGALPLILSVLILFQIRPTCTSFEFISPIPFFFPGVIPSVPCILAEAATAICCHGQKIRSSTGYLGKSNREMNISFIFSCNFHYNRREEKCRWGM